MARASLRFFRGSRVARVAWLASLSLSGLALLVSAACGGDGGQSATSTPGQGSIHILSITATAAAAQAQLVSSSPVAATSPTATLVPVTFPIEPRHSKIAAGDDHTCAVTEAGGVMCWGRNDRGQLGDGSTTNQHTPTPVRNLSSGVLAVSAGAEHTCALMEAGGVFCWGRNNRGQLGDGSTEDRLVPAQVAGLTTGVRDISAGGAHTCAVSESGGVLCWGRNNRGQLGGGTENRSEPVQVQGLSTGVRAIAAGGERTCALKATGVVTCWGANQGAQSGDDIVTPPVDARNLSGVHAIAVGGTMSCALTAIAGEALCWGRNGYGELGDKTFGGRSVPAPVLDLAGGVQAIATGEGHVCAVTAESTVMCWGWNNVGQFGNARLSNSASPVQGAGSLSGVTDIAAGSGHTCAIVEAGGIMCWGSDMDGQLGDGELWSSTMPVRVLGFGPSSN